MSIKIGAQQACIIYSALGYAANKEGVEISESLQETYEVVSESNPFDSDMIDIVDIMELLESLIRKECAIHFEEEYE